MHTIVQIGYTNNVYRVYTLLLTQINPRSIIIDLSRLLKFYGVNDRISSGINNIDLSRLLKIYGVNDRISSGINNIRQLKVHKRLIYNCTHHADRWLWD